MKIALIDPSLFTWPYDRALTTGLREIGNEAILFSRFLGPKDRDAPYDALREHFYPGLSAPRWTGAPRALFLPIKGMSHIRSMARLLPVLRTWKPDVIHFQWTPLPVIDQYFIPRLKRVAPVVLTVHDSAPFNQNPSSRLQTVASIRILGLFERLIVHTEQARQRLAHYGLPVGRIARVPHGMLHERQWLSRERSATSSNSGKVTLLQFGKVKHYKGVDVLIRALALLPAAVREQCRVDVVGQPHMDTKTLTDLARGLDVQDCLRFDFRFVGDTEMQACFDRADVLLMPYREIDASGVLMTAVALGKPVIASRLGAFAEMLADGRQGKLVAPDDPPALAQALAEVIEDASSRNRMADEMRTLRDAIPSWNDIAKQTIAVYRQTFS